jgi:hypothetical protein
MEKPAFWVDFNERIEADLVGLSNSETKMTRGGLSIRLSDGLQILIYEYDTDEDGNEDNLVASGVVELNKNTGWSSCIRWCCRIDRNGIRHESDLKN